MSRKPKIVNGLVQGPLGWRPATLCDLPAAQLRKASQALRASKVVGPFPAHVRPCTTRPGPYRRASPFDARRLMWSWWDGKRWGCMHTSIDSAYRVRNIASEFQALPWYGYRRPRR